MRILINPVGSHGDVLPFVALGKSLRDRGHDVRLYTSAYFEPLVRQAGLAFSPTMSVEDYLSMINNPDINHPMRVMRIVVQMAKKYLGLTYQTMAKDVVPGNTLVIGPAQAFATRSLADSHHVPVATVHLQPVMLRSRYEAQRLSARLPSRGPGMLTPLKWRLADLIIDNTVGKAINHHRTQLGLRPVRRLLHEWIHQADILIGMFPSWFASPQPDWPKHLHQTGFPLYDNNLTNTLPAPVETFLAEGEPPIAFTVGTATTVARDFFEVSVEACRQSGRRGLLLTSHEAQVPSSLPASVAKFGYVPFGPLLPRLAAFVHHGGIGSTSQAFRAGVPQLIRPIAHDQFDNSHRAQRLGVASELLPKDYKVDAVVAALDRVIGDENLKSRCAELARLVEIDGIGAACDRILEGVQGLSRR
jgi:rhamnosyltransferase subunit B